MSSTMNNATTPVTALREISDCCGKRAKFIDDDICCLGCFEPCGIAEVN